MKQHVTIKEIARLLDCSTKTVRRKVEKGLIPAIQLGGQGTHIRFDIDDVIRAVKETSPTKGFPTANAKSADDEVHENFKKRPGPPPKWKQKLNQLRRDENE